MIDSFALYSRIKYVSMKTADGSSVHNAAEQKISWLCVYVDKPTAPGPQHDLKTAGRNHYCFCVKATTLTCCDGRIMQGLTDLWQEFDLPGTQRLLDDLATQITTR